MGFERRRVPVVDKLCVIKRRGFFSLDEEPKSLRGSVVDGYPHLVGEFVARHLRPRTKSFQELIHSQSRPDKAKLRHEPEVLKASEMHARAELPKLPIWGDTQKTYVVAAPRLMNLFSSFATRRSPIRSRSRPPIFSITCAAVLAKRTGFSSV
jgi:hypothetical protein